MAKLLSAERILSIHELLVRVFAGLEDPVSPPGVRDLNLLYSAAARPFTGLGKTEKYPSILFKGAALFHSLVTNHPFHNGNKRTALVSLVTFLAENHRRLIISDDEIFDFVTSVAQGFVPGFLVTSDDDEIIRQIAKWIDDRSAHLHTSARAMRAQDFIAQCVEAGAKSKISGGQWVILGPNSKSIRVSRSAKHLPGSVVRVYLSKLGLSESQAGITFEEFQAGWTPEQDFVQTLMVVLRRLAHA